MVVVLHLQSFLSPNISVNCLFCLDRTCNVCDLWWSFALEKKTKFNRYKCLVLTLSQQFYYLTVFLTWMEKKNWGLHFQNCKVLLKNKLLISSIKTSFVVTTNIVEGTFFFFTYRLLKFLRIKSKSGRARISESIKKRRLNNIKGCFRQWITSSPTVGYSFYSFMLISFHFTL